MKTLLTLAFSAIFSLLPGQDESAKVIEMTYHHGLKLEEIQVPGNKFVFKQFCTTQIDSLVSSGNIKHQGSKIGRIGDCIYQWQIRQDTLKAIIIETSRRKNTEQVIDQATDQFGIPTEMKSDAITTYVWIVQKAENIIYAKLIVDEFRETGIMTITN